jgi:hypothetical protein
MPSEGDVIETALEALTPSEMLKSVLGDITNPIGIIKAILWLGKRNGAKAAAYFREAMDEMTVLNAQQVQDVTKRADAHEQRLDEMDLLQERVLEMVLRPEEWKGREHEKPPWSDVVTRAKEFERDVWGAGSHGKRKILVNAFFNSFKPEFYAKGWSNHLWRIAEQIEYPECRVLAEQIRRDQAKEQPDPKEFTSLREKHYLARRLEDLGLVKLAKLDHARTLVAITEVGRRFKQFVWDEEMWRDEKPAG